MSEQTSLVEWRRGDGEAFLDRRDSRRDRAAFDLKTLRPLPRPLPYALVPRLCRRGRLLRR